jgi:hypothetical protein
MPARNLNWYNLQSTRQYPLDDSATGETDEHITFPNDMLVDAHIRFPDTLGKYAYVQGVTSTAGLVTVLIGASATLNTEGQTIAAVSIPRPVYANVNYDIVGLVPGVAGWLTFGPGIEAMFAGRFSAPTQTFFNPRNARPYRPLPIPTIGKLGLSTALTDIVNILGEAPVSTTVKKVSVGGREADAIIFKLSAAAASGTYNPFADFLSPCAQRPESGTCPKTPIETINGVPPDCYGNINIEFSSNIIGQLFANCGGIDLLTPTTLKQACAPTKNRRTSTKDLCCPDTVTTLEELYAIPVGEGNAVIGKIYGVTATTPTTYYQVANIVDGAAVWEPVPASAVDAFCGWPDPTDALTPDVVVTLPSIQDYPCLTLPACIDFCSCGEQPPLFETRSGRFDVRRTAAPFGCVPCGTSEPPPQSLDALGNTVEKNTYTAIDDTDISVATLKNCATDWAYNKTIATQFKVVAGGLSRNAGIVINYRHDTTGLVQQVKYLAAIVDINAGQLQFRRYVNASSFIETQARFLATINTWYELIVTPLFTGSGVTLKIRAQAVANPNNAAELIVPVSADKYGPPLGAYGIFSRRAQTHFNRFTISE